MSLNLKLKRVRLLWNETLQTSTCNIIPYVSFDNGDSWTDISNEVETLRINGNSTLGSKTTNSDTSTKMDLSICSTPYAIPKIEKIEAVTVSNTESSNLPSPGNFTNDTTYYFAVASTNYDTTGLDTVTDPESQLYYIGPVDGDSNFPISNVKSVTIPAGDAHYHINLYIKYPNFIKGLMIYYGSTAPVNNKVTLDLKYITNLTNKLNTEIGPNDNHITVKLANKWPLPSHNGKVKINDEIFTYKSQSYTDGNWTIILDRSSNSKSTHTIGSIMYFYCDTQNNTTLPAKLYPCPDTSGMVQYLSFDSKNVIDVVGNSTPTITGSLDYSEYISKYNNSLKLTGAGVVETNLDLVPYKKEGSIHFYTNISDFTQNGDDPYIFSPKVNTSGLFCRISRLTKKIYVGYRLVAIDSLEYKDIILFNYDDYRLNVLKSNSLDSIGISWQVETDNYVSFYLYMNSYITLHIKSNIYITSFTPGNLVIGGAKDDNGVLSNTYIGYFDDWRVYSSNIALNYINKYTENILNPESNKAIVLNSNTDTSIQSTLNQYVSTNYNRVPLDGDVLNTVYIVNGIRNYKQYIYITMNKYDDSSIISKWKINSKDNLSFNDIDDYIGTDENNIYTGKLRLTGVEPNYNDSTNNILSTSTSPYYIPKLKTSMTLNYADNYTDDKMKVYYDNWALNAYLQGGWTSAFGGFITYPVFPSTIQIKYKLSEEGTTTGFTTPVLSAPSTIVSEMSV